MVLSRKNAWQAYFACASVLMIISSLFVQRFDTDLARRYSFKQFMEHVLATVKDDPLYFYGSSDFGVSFYANKRVPVYADSLGEKGAPVYLLCWENDWQQIRDIKGLSIVDASDSIDRQSPKRGHLYLVAVNRPAKPKAESGRSA